jgi:hypothetical protein
MNRSLECDLTPINLGDLKFSERRQEIDTNLNLIAKIYKNRMITPACWYSRQNIVLTEVILL